jgi:hypothetical protein
MVYKQAVIEYITDASISKENIVKICTSLNSQRIRRVQYDMIKKDQEHRRKTIETEKMKKQTFLSMDPSMELDKQINDNITGKIDDSNLELDSLLSSNVTLSDSAVEKLLGKRKDIRPITVKEEIPTIKIEDTSLKKAKKPKIVID